MLLERRKVISDGIILGEQMEREKAKLDEKQAAVLREARVEADKIVAIAHKESREVIREAEKTAKSKADAIIAEADEHIKEDAEQARRRLEKDIIGLVSEATEAVVHEKVDAKKDAEIVDKALKGRRK
jgi:F-type H+-transporting ATPase subunit b